MTRPTKEQLEPARSLAALTIELTRHDLPPEVYQAFATIIAATAEPTDDQLAAEALAKYNAETGAFADEDAQKTARLGVHEGGVWGANLVAYAAAYADGARREGAR